MSAEPMSPERRAEIERAIDRIATVDPLAPSLSIASSWADAARDLLAEVDRLRSVEAAAIEWYEAGADVVPLDGRAHRSIRNLRSAVRAALSGEHPLTEADLSTCEHGRYDLCRDCDAAGRQVDEQ